MKKKPVETSAAGTEGKTDSRRKIQSDFPKHTLEEALRVAKALEEANSGQPLPPIETANALGLSPGSSEFRIILSASIKYGLTSGSYTQERVSLEGLGRSIVEPRSDEEAQRAIVKAALLPPTFQAIYDYYKGKKLPEEGFFANTVVREFNVPREHAKKCIDIFNANVDFARLITVAKTGRWLSQEPTPKHHGGLDSDRSGVLAEEGLGEGQPLDGKASETTIPTPGPAERRDMTTRRVFISHGKNKGLVATIKKLLAFGELDAVISVERASVSQPVPEKVMGEMRTCGAAIINVESEEVLLDSQENERPVINSNVLIEIGASMALYGKRFILLVRDGLKLPSNLQGLYEVRYQGESLDGETTIRLLEAINDIKNHRIPDRYRNEVASER